MFVAIISLILNASLNYLLAFVLNFGHVGIAIGSSIAALVSVLILEGILYKDGFIKMHGVINRFNMMILFSSIALITFLYFFTSMTNFMNFNQPQRFIFLTIEIIISIAIYFSVSKLIYKKPLKNLFN